MSRARLWTALLLVCAALALIPAVRSTLGHGLALLATGQLAQFQQFLRALGVWAPVVSIALMVAESLAIPVPVTIIMVANGLVFGTWRGMLVSFIGGMAGALAAYGVGRQLGRVIVARLLPASSLKAADDLMSRYGNWAVVLERWIPGVPGDPMSYAAGLTRMPVATFALMTTIGLAPANVVTAFIGEHVAGDVPLRYWFGGIGAIVVIWLAVKTVRQKS
jgi:uncharacterized membrane protein YdjX (TVP38/TMEM64 family)